MYTVACQPSAPGCLAHGCGRENKCNHPDFKSAALVRLWAVQEALPGNLCRSACCETGTELIIN